MVAGNSFTTTFGVGDTVFTIIRQKVGTPVTCDICTSTGKVTLNGESFTCPKCHGAATDQGFAKVAVTGTVKQILVTKCTLQCKTRYLVERATNTVTLNEAEVFATEAAATASIV